MSELSSVTLSAPYTPGTGTFLVNGLVNWLLTANVVPNQITVFQRSSYGSPYQVSGTYSIAGLGGNSVLGCVLISGIDAPYQPGDFVQLVGVIPQSITLSALLDTITSTQGSVLFRSTTAWVGLGPGTSGQFLQSQGGSADVRWASSAGSGTVTSITFGSGLAGGTITTSGTATLASQAASSLLANPTGSSAIPSAVLLGPGLGFSGSTLGVTYPTVIAPSIATSQNNWSPSGFLAGGAVVCDQIRATITAAGVVITGLAAPTAAGLIEGAPVVFEVALSSPYPVIFACSGDARASSSSAANRFAFPYNGYLLPGQSIKLFYDATAAQWRGTGIPDPRFDIYGSGADGDVTWNSTAPLNADLYARNLTLGSTCAETISSVQPIVQEWLFLGSAPSGAIIGTGGAGGAGSGATAGIAGVRAALATSPTVGVGLNGAAGQTGVSGTGGPGGPGATTGTNYNALQAANGGIGGAGSGGPTGGGSGTPLTPIQASIFKGFIAAPYYQGSTSSPALAHVHGGQNGASGGAGGGDAASSLGGGSGGSGAGGAPIYIRARFIDRGGNTNTGIIQSKGGAGGAGGAGTGTNSGGGAGSGAGQGGTVIVTTTGIFGNAGIPIAGAIDCSGGNGGLGGAKQGTGVVGNGGGAGPGGYVAINNTATGVFSGNPGPARVLAPTGGVTTGAVATTFQIAL